MATEKQIAANRGNAKRSTGPKTIAGKMKSSRNALRHGLSCALPLDTMALCKAEKIAHALTGPRASEEEPTAAIEFAHAHLELMKIREIRGEIILEMESDLLNPPRLHRLFSIDRYERYAHTKRKQAAQRLYSWGRLRGTRREH